MPHTRTHWCLEADLRPGFKLFQKRCLHHVTPTAHNRLNRLQSFPPRISSAPPCSPVCDPPGRFITPLSWENETKMHRHGGTSPATSSEYQNRDERPPDASISSAASIPRGPSQDSSLVLQMSKFVSLESLGCPKTGHHVSNKTCTLAELVAQANRIHLCFGKIILGAMWEMKYRKYSLTRKEFNVYYNDSNATR